MNHNLETVQALQRSINQYEQNKPTAKYPEIFDEIIKTLKAEQAELINSS